MPTLTLPPIPGLTNLADPVLAMPHLGLPTFLRAPYTRDLTGASVAVLGNPWDGSATYRSGARLGPQAVRLLSAQVQTEYAYIYPWRWHLADRGRLIDCGDVPHSPGYVDTMLYLLEEASAQVAAAGVRQLTLGGDHLTPLPVLRALAKRHGPLALVHFDSHTDTWATDPTTHNHATYAHHAVHEGLVDPHASVMAYIRTEYDDAQALGYTVLDAFTALKLEPAALAARIRQVVGARPCYLSFDVDALDPAYAPGTGTPIPGGPTTAQVREVLFHLAGLPVIAADVVELAPPFDTASQTTALSAAFIAADLVHLMTVGS